MLLLTSGLIAGVVVAAAAFPAVAVTGLAAKGGADSFEKLPGDLRVQPLPQNTYVYANDGKTLITQFYEENRQYVPLSGVAPVMQHAIIAAEDTRFYEHNGVDFRGVVRALVANRQAGEVSQGASTLTMQYVRQTLVYTASTPEEVRLATEDTSTRKIREMRYAMRLEKELSKDEILTRYLNIAYFGHRAYGIYAASLTYFSKLPSQLTVPEAAMLAGLVQAPSAYDPGRGDKTNALQRRNYVIDQMAKIGDITPAEAKTAAASPITLRLRTEPNDCVSVVRQDFGFFCDFFRNWWVSRKEFGETTIDREDRLRRGGYRIVSSLDPNIQTIAQRVVFQTQKATSPFAMGEVIIQPGTGKVRAMAVNRVYSLDQSHNGPHTDPARRKAGVPGNYPNTVNPLLGGGGLPGYQAGSTFKIFTMLTALERGLPLNTTMSVGGSICTPWISASGPWCPTGTGGTYNMWGALGVSSNPWFVKMVMRVGPQNVVRMAERMGLQWRDSEDKRLASDPRATRRWGSFTLGTANTTPLEMANVAATIAADGKYCAPLPVESITDRAGGKIPVPTTCKQVITPDLARAAADAMRCPVGQAPFRGSCGGATARRVGALLGRPVAGKTGTTDSNRAKWFVGMTPQLAAAAFLADPDYRMTGVPDLGAAVSTVGNTLRDAHRGLPVINFKPESNKIAYGSGGKPPPPKKPAKKPAKKPTKKADDRDRDARRND